MRGAARRKNRRMLIGVTVDSEGACKRTLETPGSCPIVSAEYYYRRKLVAKDLVPAAGVAVAAGLAVFYVVQLLIQRTPLIPTSKLPRDPLVPPRRALGGKTEPETETHDARELPPGKPPAARLRTG
jgi:hypothetical protein